VVLLPFLVIDLVVAGTLATLGLVSLPAAVLALPFKVLLFVMVDGWRLLAYALLSSLQ
jgi:flagellar biosynthetic protein FliP